MGGIVLENFFRMKFVSNLVFPSPGNMIDQGNQLKRVAIQKVLIKKWGRVIEQLTVEKR